MKLDDVPLTAWDTLCPDERPADVEVLGPQVWRVGVRVLKQFPKADLKQFRRIVRAHRQAGRIFRGKAGLAAQRLSGFDDDSRAVLLDWVPGRSGRMALLAGADPAVVMAQAGAWLYALHNGREQARGAFDALGPINRLPAAPGCAGAEGYDLARAALARDAAHLQGREVTRAVLHGDMTLANLLFSAAQVTGIDFENLAHHSAARDVGDLWADLLLYAPQVPAGVGLMPGLWAAAFASAYPGLEPDVVGFFTRHRLLRIWAAIPARERQRGPVRAGQWANLQVLQSNGAFQSSVTG